MLQYVILVIILKKNLDNSFQGTNNDVLQIMEDFFFISCFDVIFFNVNIVSRGWVLYQISLHGQYPSSRDKLLLLKRSIPFHG